MAALKIFEGVLRRELEWLVEHGTLRVMETGFVMTRPGQLIEEMAILVEGRAALYVEKGGTMRRLMEAPTGYVIGTLPFSRIQSTPGTVIIEERVTAWVLHRRHFDVLVRDHPGLTAAFVHQMLDR